MGKRGWASSIMLAFSDDFRYRKEETDKFYWGRTDIISSPARNKKNTTCHLSVEEQISKINSRSKMEQGQRAAGTSSEHKTQIRFIFYGQSCRCISIY